MAEDTKGDSSSGREAPEKKPAPFQPSSGARIVFPAPAGAGQQAARVLAPPPPPVAPPAWMQQSKPTQPASFGRRNFVKFLVTVGTVLSVVPFVPWGSFLSSSVSHAGALSKQKVVVDNVAKYGAAAGRAVNVNDLSTFPPNSHWVITYPSSGNIDQDAQNPDTFVKYELIRIPVELGGDAKAATSFVAFSKVCVHLWCSPNYNPTQNSNPNEGGYNAQQAPHEQYECPCHGSIYEIPDGNAVHGPAALQPPPTNAIPMLTLTADISGVLHAEVRDGHGDPVWDVEYNGVLGYGRNSGSYQTHIRPAAQGSA